MTLHKKLSFPLRISSVNVTSKFTEEILNRRLYFLCSETIPNVSGKSIKETVSR